MQGLIKIIGRLRISPACKLLIMLIPVVLMLLIATPSSATEWDYRITDIDTPATIDKTTTTAEIDTVKNEIRLKLLDMPDAVSFWGSGEMDYVVLTTTGIIHYSYDGSKMVENKLLSIPGTDLTNPMALAATESYPDIVVTDDTGIKHYSFTGSGMIENPLLSISGLTPVTSVGTSGMDKIAALIDGGIQYYEFTGGAMERNSILEPTVALDNPIDISLGSGGYDTAVLEKDRVRWFNFNGTGMIENTALAVTGLTGAKAFAIADPNGGYDVAVVDGAQVKHYGFTGSKLAYNSTLSVTSGLAAPRAVAIRPGSNDRVIVDGDQIRYYQWDGSELKYNSELSITVADIVKSNRYTWSSVAQSVEFDPEVDVDYVCVRAVHELPDKTSVTWSVTADGINWIEKWRVTGTPTGTTCEIKNAEEWTVIGDAAQATPDAADARLWATVEKGRAVKWRAELATLDYTVTPVIAATPRGDTAVKLITNASPLPPELPTYETCFAVTNPILEWEFEDPDESDTQSKYAVEVFKENSLELLIESGEVTSVTNGYQIEPGTEPDMPSKLWNSGGYRFKYRVMVWDQVGAPSPWSDYGEFCIVAFERPRIAEIISPPAGQDAPDPGDASTHIAIIPGMEKEQLPRAKAGAKVVLLVDSIGPITNPGYTFPYLDKTSSVNIPENLPDEVTGNPMYTGENAINRWCVEFWTNGNLSICPSGTVVGMYLTGAGSEGQTKFEAPPYSEGVILTEGSIYGDWQVVLQGRDR